MIFHHVPPPFLTIQSHNVVGEIPKFWWHPMNKIIENSAFSSSLIKESSHCKRCSCSNSSALMCPAGGSFAWWFFSTEMGIKPTSSVTSTKKHLKKIWQEHPRGYVVIFVDMIFILEKIKVVLYPSCRVNTLSWLIAKSLAQECCSCDFACGVGFLGQLFDSKFKYTYIYMILYVYIHREK